MRRKIKVGSIRHQSARDHSRYFPANAASLCTMVRKTEIIIPNLDELDVNEFL